MANQHAAHTAGPWTMQTVRTDCGVCFKVGPFPWKRGQINHACIYADYPGNGPEYQELVANATLMAAAPELLAALQALNQMYVHAWDRVDGALWFAPSSVEKFERIHEQACAALAKATGAAS